MDSSRLKVCALENHLIEPMWPYLEPHLAEVVRVGNGEMTLEALKNKALNGDLLLVPVFSGSTIYAVCTFRILTFDSGKKALLIEAVGSKGYTLLNEWINLILDAAKDMAKDFGCSELRGCSARKGWLRKLKGWQPLYEIIALPLNGE